MTTIRTSEFEQLFELLRSGQHGLKCLSLDCFDTILWRNVHEPFDVFYRLQHEPTFSRLHFDAVLRQAAESDARKINGISKGVQEVSLEDIFSTAFPEISIDDLNALAQEELRCEQDACFAYPAMLDLIRVAKQIGLKVVVVSDTYFSEPQLKSLLEHNLPDDVFAAIDHLFCSNVYGLNKASGLFAHVFNKLRYRPEQILHIGDNLTADFEAPQAHGMSAFHFVQSSKTATQVLQMNGNATGLLCPEVRTQTANPSPFHAVFASSAEDETDPVTAMGYFAAGPLLYTFSRFLKAHAERSLADGSSVKYLFLMRDGYLPQLAFEQLCPQYAARSFAVEISRFVAYACSFRTEADVDRFIAKMGSDRIEPMAEQLLLSEEDRRAIIPTAENSTHPRETFAAQVKRPALLKKIFKASGVFRQRLYRYLEKVVDLKPGDHLVFVDLGYSGTAQLLLQPILEAERDVSLEGLYLLLGKTPDWRGKKRGMIDPDLVSDSAVGTLVQYVAALEMICTSNAGSAIDYSEDGDPIRKAADISVSQQQQVKQVQQACLRFVSDCDAFYHQAGELSSLDELRRAAVGVLGRMSFFATAPEIECLRGFYFDVNLSTDLTVPLFDTERALTGLRKMGLFNALTELRMNIPTELRYHNLELSLALMVQHRYHQNYSLEDFSLKREQLNVMVAKGADTSLTEASAFPGYDGFYTLLIPVGACEYSIGVQFGMKYELLQLGSVVAMAVKDVFARKDFNKDEQDSEMDLSDLLHLDQIEQTRGGILHCESENAFLFVDRPKGPPPNDNMFYLINFRPLVRRGRDEG